MRAAASGPPEAYHKDRMHASRISRRLTRACFAVLLAIQALGGAAVTLAHARDAVAAPAGYEAGHDGRCAILHDELRCALCHYASTRVVAQNIILIPAAPVVRSHVPVSQLVVSVASDTRLTAPARAPPPFLS